MDQALVAILAASLREQVREQDTLTDKIKAAFREAQSFWTTNDEEVRFQGALAAVMLESGQDDKRRVELTVKAIYAIGAVFRGIRTDVGGVLNEFNQEFPDELPLPIRQLWLEAKGGT